MSHSTKAIDSGVAKIEKEVGHAVNILFNLCEPLRGATDADKSVFKNAMLTMVYSAFFAGTNYTIARHKDRDEIKRKYRVTP